MAKEGKDNSKDIIKEDNDEGNQQVRQNSVVEPNDKVGNNQNNNANPNSQLPNRISEYGGRVKDSREENSKEDKIDMGLSNIDKKYEFLSESAILENKNLIYPEDPRISVDFGGQVGPNQGANVNMGGSKFQQDNFMNKTQYDPNLYSRREFYGGYDMSSNKSVYNPNMSTMRFIAEIDLRCDDHLNKLKEDFQADRYCSECKVLCCDSCVIEYHNSHIQAAKVRVEEYFKKQKIELEDLKSKMNVSIKQKSILNELGLTMDIHEKNISTYFLRRRNLLESLRGKIETLLADENDLYNKLKENIHAFYQDECFRRMEKPLRETESLLFRLQNFLRDWDSFSRTDKARAIKNDQITNFKSEANDLNEHVKNSVETFKNKSKMLEKNLDEILKLFAYNDKINQIESILFDITGKVKSSFAQINKLNFDDLVVDEAVLKAQREKEEMELRNSNNSFNLIQDNRDHQNGINQGMNQNVYKQQNMGSNNVPNQYSGGFNFNNMNNSNNNFQGNNSNINPNNQNIPNTNQFNYVNSNYNYQQPNTSNKIPVINNNMSNMGNNIPLNTNVIPNNPNSNLNNSNVSYPSFPNQVRNNNQSQELSPFFAENKHNYDLLIGIKPKSDELIVFDPKLLGFTTLKLNQNQFQDKSTAFQIYPDNCRYVNLGFSILVTGGYIKKEMSSNCYLIVLCKKEVLQMNQDPYDVSIMPYAHMIEPRDRHNIVNLPDRNMVMVCSGFFNQNVEITDVNAGTWKQLPRMNDVRANATVAYVNKRFVWVIGGFKINEKQVGVYQNSAEVYDLDAPSNQAGWALLDFTKMNLSLKLSAMGVINIHENSFLVCGGYDGTQYKKDVNKIDVFERDVLKLDKFKSSLPGNYIFLHNNFVKIDNLTYNYDLQMNLIIFNPADESFQIQSYKK